MGVVRAVTDEGGRDCEGDAPVVLYSRGEWIKAAKGGSSALGMVLNAKLNRVWAKLHRDRLRGALNPNQGVAENGRVLVNANCPLKGFESYIGFTFSFKEFNPYISRSFI